MSISGDQERIYCECQEILKNYDPKGGSFGFDDLANLIAVVLSNELYRLRMKEHSEVRTEKTYKTRKLEL